MADDNKPMIDIPALRKYAEDHARAIGREVGLSDEDMQRVLKRDDLIDAGLTPRATFLEAPYERAMHALTLAVDETANAIWTAPSKADVLTFRVTLEEAIGKLNAQSATAQTLADTWAERSKELL